MRKEISREEAIQILNASEYFWLRPTDKEREALCMAVNSLEIDAKYNLAYEDANTAEPWIDLHDKMPEKGINDFVLCCFENGYVDTCTRGYLQESEKIIAWMPLPEPYRGKG